jgi:hypothetical protein
MTLSPKIFSSLELNNLNSLNRELAKKKENPFDLRCEAFNIAYSVNNLSLVHRLLEEHLNYKGFHPETVLSLAIQNKDEFTTKFVLKEYREEVNFDYGNSEIFLNSCIKQNIFLVKLLLEETSVGIYKRVVIKALNSTIENNDLELFTLLTSYEEIRSKINSQVLEKSKEYNFFKLVFNILIDNKYKFCLNDFFITLFEYGTIEMVNDIEKNLEKDYTDYVKKESVLAFKESLKNKNFKLTEYLFTNYSDCFNEKGKLQNLFLSVCEYDDSTILRFLTSNNTFKKFIQNKNDYLEKAKDKKRYKIIKYIFKIDLENISTYYSIIQPKEIIYLSEQELTNTLSFLGSYSEFTIFYSSKWITKNIKNKEHQKILKLALNIGNF